MFTMPIGFFSSSASVLRPNAVIDTPGAGTITNSAFAFDNNPSSFADFVGHVLTPGPSTTYSVYSFAAGPTTKVGQNLNVKYATNTSINDYGQIQVSIDGGSTYTTAWVFQTLLSSPSSPFTVNPFSFPNGTAVGSIKVKITTLYGFSDPTEVYIYDIYIQ